MEYHSPSFKENSDPILSVVIPAYNAEATIESCVKSILSNRNIPLEIIIVDDGSKDRTKSIIDALAESEPQIKVIHKQNGGVGAARNTGMDAAAGQYITFVDADDTVSEHMYPHMLSLAEKESADCVVCNIENRFADHTERESHVFGNSAVRGSQNIHERLVVPLIVPGHADAALLQSVWNKLYRTVLIQNHGLRFTHLPWAEDWLFNIEYLMKTECVVFTHQYLYYYDRTTLGSLSKTWNPENFRNTVWIQNRLAELFPERYTQEQLVLGVLGIQREQLYAYANTRGLHGFARCARILYCDKELRAAYQEVNTVPAKYRFAQKCIENHWERGYIMWAAWLSRKAFLMHLFRPTYHAVRNLLRKFRTQNTDMPLKK